MNRNKWGKYKCNCCGYCTLATEPENSFQICPVCFWEDDGVQFDDPNYKGGANQESLVEARGNYAKFGAINQKAREMVRPPNKQELDE